ncbi:uncharacterized protein LDX57_010674 [Aspergillus melleus]|uniref:uncharacterized protein n=1 Tax=Aspergillus melleus TaxID=138277 RepID=UPI001E8DBD5A|nr:uncharacterized protein LDX57_010674 [Aspergillus melleus]KAH8433035.1 hypothetical protein LDX57_010674 [Aspergillus melleus]
MRLNLGYETTPILGDALCAFNGTGYPRSGKPVPIPETALCTSDSFTGESDSYDDSDDEDAIDSDSYYSPATSYSDDKFNVSRKRLEFTILESEPEPEREPEDPQHTAPTTTTTHPDNEKGIIQTIPSLPLPLPVTPVDSLIMSSTLTSQLKPTVTSPGHPQPPCVPQLGVRDPNTTVLESSNSNDCVSDPAFAVLTSIPTYTPTPALVRPRMADKCTWTPTPLYRTGAGVLPSSSSSWSISLSSSLTSFSEVASLSSSSTSSVTPAKTSGGKEAGAAACLVQRTSFVVLVGWVLCLGVLLGWV